MHIRSVLKNSAVWEALVAAWRGGAVVVGSSGAAMALTDPMVDARGGGLTIGLGLIDGVAVVPHFGDAARGRVRGRRCTARCCSPRGTRRWSASPSGRRSSGTRTGRGARPGAGAVAVFLDGAPAAGLAALPA